MPISIRNGLITIQTAGTTYQMKADSLSTLIHTYYGPKIDGTDMSPLIVPRDRGFSGNPAEVGMFDKTYSLDTLPLELSSFGDGDYRITGLHAEDAGGARALRFTFKGAKILPGKYSLPGLPAVYADETEAETLEVYMADEAAGIGVTLLYGVLPETDIITRAMIVKNEGKAPVRLLKAASVSLDYVYGDFDLITFHGRHAMERNLTRREVVHGMESVGSVRGMSSHHYNPFAILAEKDTDEMHGRCFGFSFLYSGEFLFETEKDQADATRVIMGIHPDDFSWELQPGDTFTTPEVMMSMSGEGLGKLSRNFHRVIREHVIRGPWRDRRRPVLINNWEATYFDFDGKKLLEIADTAASCGLDLFVLDDGWFGKRNLDDSSLGDWAPNEEKLGMSLKALGEAIREKGLMFGIWVEPEGLSVNSDLYRQHPDWAVAVPGRNPELSRHQLILDLSRQDVQDHILARLIAIVREGGISYIKWDLNRSISGKYSAHLPKERQGEFSHRYVLGVYRVLEMLLAEFPDLLIEGCCGGGGRFDAGMLYYTPQIWCSDNTDAVNRLSIQYGTSFGYPTSAMGAHVSAVPNHQTGRNTPMKTRAITAMAGTFGYELDITKMSEAELDEIRSEVGLFRELNELIRTGDYYRLSAPKDVCTVWENVSRDGAEALLSGVWHGIEANSPVFYVRPQGLVPDALYEVSSCDADGGRPMYRMSGAALMNGGVACLMPDREYDSFLIRMKRA